MDNTQQTLLALAAISVMLGVGWAAWQAKTNQNDASQPTLNHLFDLLYFVGLPYLAVVLGMLPPRLLGLAGAEYIALINWNRPLFIQLQQTVTLTLLDWLFYLPATLAAGSFALLLFGLIWFQLRRLVPPDRRQTLLNALCLALHWAFYRAIFWRITDDLYLATVWGAALVLLELALICRIQRQPIIQNRTLQQTLLLILTALVFFFSPNLWLLLPLHWLMVALLNSSTRPASAAATSG